MRIKYAPVFIGTILCFIKKYSPKLDWEILLRGCFKTYLDGFLIIDQLVSGCVSWSHFSCCRVTERHTGRAPTTQIPQTRRQVPFYRISSDKQLSHRTSATICIYTSNYICAHIYIGSTYQNWATVITSDKKGLYHYFLKMLQKQSYRYSRKLFSTSAVKQALCGMCGILLFHISFRIALTHSVALTGVGASKRAVKRIIMHRPIKVILAGIY